jgi:hypothetical protein
MFLSSQQPPRDRPRKLLRRASTVVALAVAALAIGRVFSVDVFPVMTADSGHYVDEAISGKYTDSPMSILTPRHFKTAGYPLFLEAIAAGADAAGVDFLTLVALVQRLLLALACLWLAWELRLAAIPLLLFLSSNAFVTQANFALTEGATIPLAALFSLALIRSYRLRNDTGNARRATRWLVWAALAVSFAFLVLTKIVFATFALLMIPLAVDLRPGSPGRRLVPTRAAKIAAVLLGLSVGYVAVVSLDNYTTFGRLTPAIGSERIFYWGLWQDTFELHPENRENRRLRSFYDRGTPYRFLHRVEHTCGGLGHFDCTGPIQSARAELLVAAGDISLARARTAAFFRGLVGGGKVELEGLRERVLAASGDPAAIEAWQDRLIDRFGNRFNNGRRARVIPGIAGSHRPDERPGPAQLLITVGLLLCFLFLALRRRIAAWGIYALSLGCYALVIGAFAFVLVDLWRYIAPVWTAFAVLQLDGAASALVKLWREQEAKT